MSDIITMTPQGLVTGDHPIIPFIEGDGIGPDIWRATQSVVDAAVEKAYQGRRSLQWKEVLAGEKAYKATGSWLPDDTLEAFRTPFQFEEYDNRKRNHLTFPMKHRLLEVCPQQFLAN